MIAFLLLKNSMLCAQIFEKKAKLECLINIPGQMKLTKRQESNNVMGYSVSVSYANLWKNECRDEMR